MRIAFAEAAAIVDRVAASSRLATERVPVARAAGRVLAEDVNAPMALPSFDNSAMDGYALRAADASHPDARLRIVGEQCAGRDLGLSVGAGACLRIMTGAPMPRGSDAVVMRENVRVDGDAIVRGEAGSRRQRCARRQRR